MDTKLLKQKILDLAIRGKLVPQDPNDEPASVLLERIRAEREKLIAEGKLKRTKTTTDNRHYENVPFEIPLNWVWAKGYDIFHPMESTKPQGEFFNYIDIDAIDNVRNVVSCPKHLLCKDAPSRATRRVSKGDVLFSMVRPYLRNIAKVEIDDCIASTGFYVCKTNGAISCNYCFYMMISNYVVNGLNQFMKGDNSPSINNDNILSWLYPVPPLNEQERIVLEIEQWFNLIDSIEDNKSDLKDFIIKTKSKVLDLAIHGKLVEQDLNDEPASELLKRIAPNATLCDNSHYGQLPKSWCVVTLGTLYNHTTGKALKKSNIDGVLRKYITTSNLYWNFFDFTEVRSMYFTNEELEKCTVHKGDLLVCNGGDVGRAAVWSFDDDICIQNHISRLRPKYENVVNNKFFCYIFMYLKQKGLLNGKGVAITSLSARDLLSLSVPLPPIIEQNRIIQEIQYIEEKLEIINTQL